MPISYSHFGNFGKNVLERSLFEIVLHLLEYKHLFFQIPSTSLERTFTKCDVFEGTTIFFRNILMERFSIKQPSIVLYELRHILYLKAKTAK